MWGPSCGKAAGGRPTHIKGHISRIAEHKCPMAAVGAALSCLRCVTKAISRVGGSRMAVPVGGSRGMTPRPAAADAWQDNRG